MIILLLVLSSSLAKANETIQSKPIFLKPGFSSVIEFETTPTQVVIGDNSSFQVEKLRKSIVVRPLVDETTTNMLVYFSRSKPMLFILNSSQDSNPTLYRKIASPTKQVKRKVQTKKTKKKRYRRRTFIRKIDFDSKGDRLSITLGMSADWRMPIKPIWKSIKIRTRSKMLVPSKIWSQRKVVQPDSEVFSQFIFIRPGISKSLKDCHIIIPLVGYKKPLILALSKGV